MRQELRRVFHFHSLPRHADFILGPTAAVLRSERGFVNGTGREKTARASRQATRTGKGDDIACRYGAQYRNTHQVSAFT